jgi:hypothetical protein
MRYYDVFNGDADGICALHQLRLADPCDSILVTGLKRDIELLESVPAGDGDVVTVLDLSLDRNRAALERLLARGAVVQYFDHHFAGELPVHPNFTAAIDPLAGTCTSAIIDRHIGCRHRPWAVVGAYGDGLDAVAASLAAALGLDRALLAGLRELGMDLNYAAYGESEGDSLMRPEELYRIVSHYTDPFELIACEEVFEILAHARTTDLERALGSRDVHATPSADVWFLEDASWARRVMGTFANRLAAGKPQRAHAVLTPLVDGDYMVSVRAPRGARRTAVEFCRRFPTGGGRAAAAGINRLDRTRLGDFVQAFDSYWRDQPAGKELGP